MTQGATPKVVLTQPSEQIEPMSKEQVGESWKKKCYVCIGYHVKNYIKNILFKVLPEDYKMEGILSYYKQTFSPGQSMRTE